MMRVGIDAYTIREMKRDVFAKLEWVRAQGLDGIQFPTAQEISPKLDQGELKEVAAHAKQLDLYLEVGIPTVNPHKFTGEDLDSAQRRLEQAIRAAHLLGARNIRSTLGGPEDRFNKKVSWQQQLHDAAAFIRRLAPLLRDLGCRICLETHGDATSWELVRLAEAKDGASGILLDTANVLVRVEEPLAAAKRAAPHVNATHAKDGILFFDDSPQNKGIVRQCRPCGQGVVPWTQVLAELAKYQPDLTLSIEDHRGLYAMPIHDPEFIGAHPDLTASELGAFVGLAWQCQQRILKGEITPPHVAEAIPWEAEQDQRVQASAAHLRAAIAQVQAA